MLHLAAVDGSGRVVYSPAVASVFNDVKTNQHSTNTTIRLTSGQSLVALSGSNCTSTKYNILSATHNHKRALFTIATPGNPPTWFAEVYVDSATSITRPIGSWFGDISVRNTTGLGYATICPQGNCKTSVTSVNITNINTVCE